MVVTPISFCKRFNLGPIVHDAALHQGLKAARQAKGAPVSTTSALENRHTR